MNEIGYETIKLIWMSAITVICGGLLAYLVAFARKTNKEWQAVREACKCLLRADIIKFCTNAHKDQYMSMSYREALQRSMDAYKALDGNGVLCKEYEKTLNLPVEKK